MEKRLETLSVERLDDDFVKMFQPIHKLQMVFGCLKVNVKYGFITRSSNIYISYSLSLWALIIFATVQFVAKCDLASDAVFENVFLKIGHVIYITTIFVTFLHHLICNRNRMSAFYVQLQKIDRIILLEGQAINRSIARGCLLLSAATTFNTAIWIILYDRFLMETGYWCTYLTLLPTINNVLDMLTCYVMLYFILKRLEYMECQISLMANTDLNVKRLDCTWGMMLDGLQLTTKSLSDFVDLFQFQILGFTCQLLLWLILTVQCVIHKFKYQIHVSTSSTVFVLLTMTSIGSMMIVLCRLCEMLYCRIDNIKKTCSYMRSSSQGGSKIIYAKRILQLLEVDSNLTVYNIYTLSTRLPFQLFAIIASYTIILLQFAML